MTPFKSGSALTLGILLFISVAGFARLGLPASAQASPPIAGFFQGLAGNSTWSGQAAFTQLSETGELTTFDVPVQAYIHSQKPSQWSVGAMICQLTQCYYEGDEIEWKNGSLSVLRYDGNTIPAQLLEATSTTLSYSFVDPYGGLPTQTTVQEERRGTRFIRHTLLQSGGRIYEDYVFSVSASSSARDTDSTAVACPRRAR